MSKRRANGEGNIRKRKDGRWEGRYTVGHDPETGKAIIKNVLGKTQAEVKEKLKKAIEETERRRTIQEAYNKEHGITPTTIKKAVRDLIAVSKAVAETEVRLQKDPESMTRKELTKLIAQVEKQMRAAAADLNFEQAAELRDKMIDLKKNLDTLDK